MRRLGAFVAAVALAACVEITAGPGGVASIRLDPLPLPPSIIVGDTLRDSTGAVLRLRATAFDENGREVADAPFRFIFAPLSRDTALRDNKALVVDSLTGLVTAAGPRFIVPQGRAGVRLGERLQLLDTLEIVPRPTRLRRGPTNGDTLRTLIFDCRDPVTLGLSNAVLADSILRRLGLTGGAIGNYTTLSTLLTGDSATSDSARVRSYLVRYEILAPTNIPPVQLERGTRPAIGIIDGTADNVIRFDTTNTSGLAEPRLRLYPAGLTRTPFPRDTIPVTVRAFAVRATRDTVPSPIVFTVRLVRLTRNLQGEPITCP